MFYKKDLDIFFKDFGETCFNENGDEFKVIFDNEYLDVTPFNSNKSMSNQDLYCQIKNTDLRDFNIKVKDILIIDGLEYILKNIEYDRNGISQLKLQFNE